MKPIYFDNNATSPLDPRVLQAMLEELSLDGANPSSLHSAGRHARERLTQARQKVAEILSVKTDRIIFTSGATEALNLLIRGSLPKRKAKIVSSKLEHSSVLRTVESLQAQGHALQLLEPNQLGFIDSETVDSALKNGCDLLILSSANSETGVKNPIDEIAKIAEEYNVPFIVDAVASFGKEPFSLVPGITAFALSAHKFHGPKGAGIACLNSHQATLHLSPLLTGGPQEFSRRAGTENLAAIIGMALAIELAHYELSNNILHVQQLHDHFETHLSETVEDLIIHGKGAPRVANVSNLSFRGVDGELLFALLDQQSIAVSLGSACSSGIRPSHVLTAMGIESELVRSALRFSFSRLNTLEEIDLALAKIKTLISHLRSLVSH